MSQNIFQLFTDDPVEAVMKHLKSQVFVSLISALRSTNKSQSVLAKELGVSQPRMSNLFNGQLEMFSLEKLIEMSVRTGCTIKTEIDLAQNGGLSISLNRA